VAVRLKHVAATDGRRESEDCVVPHRKARGVEGNGNRDVPKFVVAGADNGVFCDRVIGAGVDDRDTNRAAYQATSTSSKTQQEIVVDCNSSSGGQLVHLQRVRVVMRRGQIIVSDDCLLHTCKPHTVR
jgi:hypothetical protein